MHLKILSAMRQPSCLSTIVLNEVYLQLSQANKFVSNFVVTSSGLY